MATVAKRGAFSRLFDNVLIRVVQRLIVSVILAAPFLLAGGYFAAARFYELEGAVVPPWASFVILVIGGVLAIIGLYASLAGIAPTPPLVPGEQELVMRHPTMKPAYARMILSIPLFLGAGYMVTVTLLPYVYPFVLFMIGLYFFFKGAMRYMRNLHITYTVTDRRVVHMYKFLWLNTKEIPVSRIISISEARSFFEIITGRGSVVVASGIGAQQVIKIEEINDPGPMAEAVRELVLT